MSAPSFDHGVGDPRPGDPRHTNPKPYLQAPHPGTATATHHTLLLPLPRTTPCYCHCHAPHPATATAMHHTLLLPLPLPHTTPCYCYTATPHTLLLLLPRTTPCYCHCHAPHPATATATHHTLLLPLPHTTPCYCHCHTPHPATATATHHTLLLLLPGIALCPATAPHDSLLLQALYRCARTTLWSCCYRRYTGALTPLSGPAATGAVQVRSHHSLVLLEGNYLLLDTEPWKQLGRVIDDTWFMDCPLDVAMERIVKRQVCVCVRGRVKRVKQAAAELLLFKICCTVIHVKI